MFLGAACDDAAGGASTSGAGGGQAVQAAGAGSHGGSDGRRTADGGAPAAEGGAVSRGSPSGSLAHLHLGNVRFPLASVEDPAAVGAGHAALAGLGLRELTMAAELLPGVEAHRVRGRGGGGFTACPGALAQRRVHRYEHCRPQAFLQP